MSFGEVLGWRALANDIAPATRITTSRAALSWPRPRNLRPRAISLFGLSPPCQPDTRRNVYLRILRPAEPPCPALHLCGAYSPARTPYHQPNPIHSSPRPGRGCMEDLLKRRYMGGHGPQTIALRGRMIGHAKRPRHTQTFGTLHHHVISREPTAIPESCAAIRFRWQP